MQEYGSCHGLSRLRNGLADWLGEHYGVTPDPERICITSGASQNLVSILQCFSDLNYTKAVWIVEPCYHLACGIFEDSGFAGRLHGIPEDEEGLNLEVFGQRLFNFTKELHDSNAKVLQPNPSSRRPFNLRNKPFKLHTASRKLYKHLIYAVPTCANPSGKIMTLDRRERLVKLARKYDALIISDDVYDRLQWSLTTPVSQDRPAEMRLPRFCDIDRSLGPCDNDPLGFGHAVSNGSFTKIAGPSVRTGWAEATPAFIGGLARVASTRSGGAPSQLCAAMLADLVENGQIQRFLDEVVRPVLQRRHLLMLDAIRKYILPLGATICDANLKGNDVCGGYFMWLEVSSEFSTTFIADVLKSEENIIIGHGQMFTVHGDDDGGSFHKNIRLSFSWEAEADITSGIKRIGDTFARLQEKSDYYRERACTSGMR